MLFRSPHTQIPVQIAAQHAQQAATWAAIQANQIHQRVQLLAAILADRYLGDLPDFVVSVLGAITSARRVMISVEQQSHILHRRQVVSKLDAELSAERMSEALANLLYRVQPQRDPRVYELVGFVPSAHRYLLVAVKLVPADSSRSGSDEWWVRTAYPVGQKRMSQRLAAGLLEAFKNSDDAA